MWWTRAASVMLLYTAAQQVVLMCCPPTLMGNLVSRKSKFSEWTIEQLDARLKELRTEINDLMAEGTSEELFLSRPGRSPNNTSVLSVFDLISQARLSLKRMKIVLKNNEKTAIEDVLRQKRQKQTVHLTNNPLLLRF